MRGIIEETARLECLDDAFGALSGGAIALQAATDLGRGARSGREEAKGPIVECAVGVGLGQGEGIDGRADMEIEALYVVERDNAGWLAIDENGEPARASGVRDDGRDDRHLPSPVGGREATLTLGLFANAKRPRSRALHSTGIRALYFTKR